MKLQSISQETKDKNANCPKSANTFYIRTRRHTLDSASNYYSGMYFFLDCEYPLNNYPLAETKEQAQTALKEIIERRTKLGFTTPTVVWCC